MSKSITTRPALTLVTTDAAIARLTETAAAAVESSSRAFALAVAHATRTTIDGPIPAAVLDRLAELEADHETACDAYDLTTAELEQARKELTAAARRLADAEEAWSYVGARMNEAARVLSCAREEFGVRQTADGYRKADAR